ncbi:MAG: Spy/CpxP family protein refolding chaperone [Candidatus Zixiibacteriota bacterium]
MKRTLAFMVIAIMLTSVIAMAQQDSGFRAGSRGDCSAPRMGMGMHDGRGPGHGRGQGLGDGPHAVLRFSDELGLDESQISKIKNLSEQFALERVDRKAELQKARIQLHALKADNGSENEILGMIDKVSGLEANMEKMMYKHHQTVKSILSAEQIDKLDSLQDDFCKNNPRRGDGPAGFDQGKGRGNNADFNGRSGR